jgi:hypothetical protein
MPSSGPPTREDLPVKGRPEALDMSHQRVSQIVRSQDIRQPLVLTLHGCTN